MSSRVPPNQNHSVSLPTTVKMRAAARSNHRVNRSACAFIGPMMDAIALAKGPPPLTPEEVNIKNGIGTRRPLATDDLVNGRAYYMKYVGGFESYLQAIIYVERVSMFLSAKISYDKNGVNHSLFSSYSVFNINDANDIYEHDLASEFNSLDDAKETITVNQEYVLKQSVQAIHQKRGETTERYRHVKVAQVVPATNPYTRTNYTFKSYEAESKSWETLPEITIYHTSDIGTFLKKK